MTRRKRQPPNLVKVNDRLGRLARMAHRYGLARLDGSATCPRCCEDARVGLALQEAGGRRVVYLAELRCPCGLALVGRLYFEREQDGELVSLHREHTWAEQGAGP